MLDSTSISAIESIDIESIEHQERSQIQSDIALTEFDRMRIDRVTLNRIWELYK